MPPGQESPSFETFFEDEKDRLLRVLSVITGSRGEAEDLAQEAFTRMFERWDEVGHMDDLAGYLHRTAMNLFRSQYRRARVAEARRSSTPQRDVFEAVEERDVATQALARLHATTARRARPDRSARLLRRGDRPAARHQGVDRLGADPPSANRFEKNPGGNRCLRPACSSSA